MPKANPMDYLKKPEPAVLRIPFTVESPAENGEYYIDLSQVTSLMNRKFMPQGLNWAVAGMTFITASSTTGAFYVEKLPNTWVMANSWVKGQSTWSKMNDEALAETESIAPRFLDFKIYADSGHQAQGFAANLLPGSIAGGYAIPGEWVSSKVVVPFGPASPGNTAEFEVMAVGANYAGAAAPVVSLIEGYAASRSLPYAPDPNTPADAEDADGSTPENWMSAIFNEGTDQTSEVIEDMLFDNNQPPYPFEGDGLALDTMYPGGANQLSGLEFHDLTVVSGTTVSSRNRSPGGTFPCGLIKVTATGITGSWNLFVDLVPGPMRGYLCEPMKEMN